MKSIYGHGGTLVSLLSAIPLTCLLLPAQEQRRPLAEGPLQAQGQQSVPADVRNTPQRINPPDEREVEGSTYVRPTDDEPQFVPTVDVGDRKCGDGNIEMRPDGNPYRLAFTNGDYVPPRGIDPDLARSVAADPSGATYGFVMIHGRITVAKVKLLQDLGVELLGLHTWQSFKAKIPAGSLNRLAQLPFIHWVGYARPHQKLDKVLAEALNGADAGQKFDIWVNFFDSDMSPAAEKIVIGEARTIDERADEGAVEHLIPHGPYQKALEKIGFEFNFYSDSIFAMRGFATKGQILAIRDLNFVVSVELQHGIASVDHDQALAMVGADRVRNIYPGTNVPVGWIDTGIDSTPYHTDFSGRKFRAWDTTGQGAYADGHGHGTHTGGTFFGQGRSDARYKGVAPAVGGGSSATDRIYVGRLLNNAGSLVGSPQTLWNVFKLPQTVSGTTTPKRSVVSNSWSAKSSSGYYGTEAYSRDLDTVIHTYQQTYVHSSGNLSVTPGSWCGSPSVAKNVLTVGNVLDQFSATVKPGQTSASVRYKTRDGRRKPEIVAAGQSVTSCKINSATAYTTKSGTSMSTPTIAGVLAGVVDRNTGLYQYKPAGLRALAVGSAKNGNGVSFDTSYKTGFGLINAYKMHYGTSRYKWSIRTGSYTYPSNLATFDIAIDPNCQELKVVLNWTEAAASSSATKARVNALRLWADAPPYTSGATGNISMANSQDTVIYAYGWAPTLRGKTVRFKVHAYTLAPGHKINYGVSIFQYLKPITSNTPTLTQSVNKTAVKPGEEVVLTSTLNAQSGHDEFMNAHTYFSSPSSWTMTKLVRTGADGIVQTYTGTSHTSYPYPRLGSGVTTGMTVGQGTSRAVKFTLRAPTSTGNHTLYTRATHPGTGSSTLSNARTVCVDSQAPNPIANLVSTSHPAGGWSNKTKLDMKWTAATDVGCAGLHRLPYIVSIGSPGTPTSTTAGISPTVTSYSRTVSNTSSGYYFAISALDKVGYMSARRYAGPYKIDTTLPSVTSVSINSGASKTSSLSVSVAAAGTDSYSGVRYMQYSANGTSWTGLYSYTTSSRGFNLSTLPGGSTAEGTKRVYVRLRDYAGNYSTAASDTIVYMMPPTLTAITTTQLEAVNHSYFRVTGTGFTETTRVQFGSGSISTKWTSAHENWWPSGSFRVVGDTILYVYPPQGVTPGAYGIRSYNGLSYSNTLNAKVVANTGHILRTSSTLTAGATQVIMVTKAGLKSTVSRQVIVASLSNRPSVFLPIYKFDIGNKFTSFELFPMWSFDGNGVSTLKFPTLQVFKGLRAYFQAAYIDFTKNAVWPMPVSTGVWSTLYN